MHTSPPATGEPAWNPPEMKDLIHRACFDCRSNETVWPWYSHVAPVSWLLQRDVNGGRSHLNFTAWDHPQKHAKDFAEQLKEGEMPPWFYLPMHPAARLTEAENRRWKTAPGKSLRAQSGPEKP